VANPVYIFAALVALGSLLYASRARATVSDKGGPVQPDVIPTLPLPRGIRNNNPGNIEYNSGQIWRGQIGTDGRYVVFDTPLNGLRALAKVLRTYMETYQLLTVREIIYRWAPPPENDAEAYSIAVANSLRVRMEDFLNWNTHVYGLVPAITRHENGVQPYSDALIAEAIEAARS